jgi:hypothetical protein
LAHDLIGLAWILPEIRVTGFLFYLRNPLLLGIYVKDAPSWRICGHAGLPVFLSRSASFSSFPVSTSGNHAREEAPVPLITIQYVAPLLIRNPSYVLSWRGCFPFSTPIPHSWGIDNERRARPHPVVAAGASSLPAADTVSGARPSEGQSDHKPAIWVVSATNRHTSYLFSLDPQSGDGRKRRGLPLCTPGAV